MLRLQHKLEARAAAHGNMATCHKQNCAPSGDQVLQDGAAANEQASFWSAAIFWQRSIFKHWFWIHCSTQNENLRVEAN